MSQARFASLRRSLTWRYLAPVGVLAAAMAWWCARPLAPAAQNRPGRPALVGTTDPRTPIEFSLVLRLPGQRRLARFLDNLENPASATYHHFIDAAAFGARFGLPRTLLDRATARLARDAVRVTGSYPQRTALEVRATAGTIDRLFGLRLSDYQGADGRHFHAPTGRAIVPRDLRDAVVAVAGLDNATIESDSAKANETDAVKAIEGMAPPSAKTAYDINPLTSRHITGQGEKIALIEFGTYQQSDLDGFDQQFDLPAVTPRNVAVDGGTTNGSASAVAEADLDLEVAHEIAPAAQLLDYNAPEATPSGADAFGAVVDQIVADGQASVASVSWGTCEAATSAADLRRDEQALEAAAARGITIVAASGDTGAYTCQEDNGSDHRLSVSWPSSSPFVLSVGGTSLSTTTAGVYQGETAWQDTLEQSGGGGGLSLEFPRPSWQIGPGVANQFSDGKRQLPDVAADADPWSGWDTYAAGALTVAGGTSAAAPFWAATTALIAQYARQHGVSRLGFVDPMLYAIAATPQRAPAFHDLTKGTNRYYPATKGWDFATGLGSPDVYHLAQDLMAYMKR
ncbi:MAG TPA: S53 family peptidase [Solirubrobacteraceae bacterium]|nr:S53 family peptidase [Solirubrobacteraceae bacterium]HUA44280.1 S53 family peptidase [Solirubrobacteraceae bacterium]